MVKGTHLRNDLTTHPGPHWGFGCWGLGQSFRGEDEGTLRIKCGAPELAESALRF